MKARRSLLRQPRLGEGSARFRAARTCGSGELTGRLQRLSSVRTRMTRTYQVASILPQAGSRRSTEGLSGLVCLRWMVMSGSRRRFEPAALRAEETRE